MFTLFGNVNFDLVLDLDKVMRCARNLKIPTGFSLARKVVRACYHKAAP